MAGLIDAGLERLFAALPEARVVGGAVRDGLLGLPPGDIDLAVALAPPLLTQRLEQAGIAWVPTGLGHGTVTATLAGSAYEITSLRRDVATDGRRAVIAYTGDWREDAARRDFTINAMSRDRACVLYDYFGGQADLAAGRVRFVGQPAARIAEDRLRILRFFRFFARFGRGAPDADALAAIAAAAAGIDTLSAARVWREIAGLLASPDPQTALDLMARTGVLQALLPRGFDLGRLARLGPAPPLLRLAALTRDAPDVVRRFRLSGSEARGLLGITQTVPPPPDCDDAALRRALEAAPLEPLLGAARLRGDPPEFLARLRAMPRPVFPLRGRDAVALGVAPGPAVGSALARVREWWREGGCVASPQACRDALRRETRER